MPRKCQSWLNTWKEWTVPRSQAPESVLFWCGLFTLAAVLRRNVYIGRKYLGNWDCFPNMYLMLVADAGVINKSTTIGFVTELLNNLSPPLTRIPQEITVPIVLESLKTSPDSSGYLVISEFGTIMEKAGNGMYTKLVDLFDNVKIADEHTFARGKNTVEKPSLNLIGATTPDYISDNIPKAVIQGGFGSRVIWLHETKPREIRLFYNKVQKREETEVKDDLLHDLLHISSLEGEFEIDDDAVDYLEAWNKNNYIVAEGANRAIKGFFARRTTYILKLAMLIRISYTDDLRITKLDFELAVDAMKFIEEKVRNTFKAIGQNKFALTLDDMRKYVLANNGTDLYEMRRVFQADAEPFKFQELLDGLVSMRYIKIEPIDGKTRVLSLEVKLEDNEE